MWEQSWQTWKVQVSYNKGGGTDWHPSPHYKWVIFRFPGWHCTAGVLLLAEGVILSAEGVPLSGHIEFPGHITQQVSFCFLVTCLGDCEYSPVSWRCPLVWAPKFPGHLLIIILDGHSNFLELSLGCVPGCDIIQNHAYSGLFQRICMGSILHCTDMHNLVCQFFRFGLYSP